jgi:hypothetical protein
MEGEHMMKHTVLIVACVTAILGLTAVSDARAQQTGSRETFLSFNTPFALPGVSLAAGTYVFEVVDTPGVVTVVRVRSMDGTRVYLTALTQLVSRPRGLPKDRHITFNEVATGMVPQVKAWYPVGDSIGREFMYPKARPSLATH